MKDYVLREDVLRCVEEDGCDCELDLGYPDHNVAFREIIKEIPAADVRPVVFCKDCDLWNEGDSSGKESLGNFRCSCAYWSVEDGPIYYTAKTDFCSYGKNDGGVNDGKAG